MGKKGKGTGGKGKQKLNMAKSLANAMKPSKSKGKKAHPFQVTKKAAAASAVQAQPEKKKAGNAGGMAGCMPYKAADQILLVGEGNFSFAAALCTVLEDGSNITATSYDSAKTVHSKYDDASQHLESLKQWGVTVHNNIDATKLHSEALLQGQFSRIVFNFPHAGAGIKDQQRNIATNQELLCGFFRSCLAGCLTEDGEVHVTVKKGDPYDKWNITKLASLNGLHLKTCLRFDPAIYPGYEHRRTLGFQEGISTDQNEEIRKGCRTFVFVAKQQSQ